MVKIYVLREVAGTVLGSQRVKGHLRTRNQEAGTLKTYEGRGMESGKLVGDPPPPGGGRAFTHIVAGSHFRSLTPS